MRMLLTVALLAAMPAAAQTIQPGEWRSTTTMTVLSMPDTPPEVLKAMASKAIVSSVCVTAADAAAGPQKLFASTRGKCSYTDFRMSGGVIATRASCGGGPGGTMTMVSKGSYTATSYALNSRMETPSGMKMTSESRATRTGPCKK